MIEQPFQTDVWFSGTRHLAAAIPLRNKTIESLTLDPDNRFQDLDRTNNSWGSNR